MEIQVREQHLPGIGVRYDLELADDRTMFVITDRSGTRHVGLVGQNDAPAWQITLEPDRAVMLAALLLGARFTLDTRGEDRVAADEVVVDTITLTDCSPVIGAAAADIRLPGEDASVLAVICDTTPELIEDRAHRCRPGDRAVIAARAADIDDVTDYVRGQGQVPQPET
ncbi:MAG: hypothetical protein IPM45_09525 [Acidimicrobiales bacterium]|nr:hypothetical protein [Acidimicrobiales bacterium]